MKPKPTDATLTIESPQRLEAGALSELRLRLQPPAVGVRVEVAVKRDGVELLRASASESKGDGVVAEAGRYGLQLPPFEAGARIEVECSAWGASGRLHLVGGEAVTFMLEVANPLPPALDRVDGLLTPVEAERARSILAGLGARGISTVADLVAAGAPVLEPLGEADRREVSDWMAHAALAPAVADASERRKLLDAGFRSPAAIAARPLAEFRAATTDFLDKGRAADLHRVASVQAAFVASAAMGAPRSASSPGSAPCACPDCEAATSPAAYLADLVAYVAASVVVRQTGPGGLEVDSALDVGALTELLQQPLADLVVSCAAVEDPVQEARLCIETLRRYLRTSLPPDSDLSCFPESLPIDLVLAGDVDGDGRDELVVAFRGSLSAWADLPPDVRSGVWVMDYDPAVGRWSHLRPQTGATGADFYLGAGLVARSGFCADLDGDGRAEVVLLVGREDGSADPQLGKSWFWVMDLAAGQASWQHLNPGVFQQAGTDLPLADTTIEIASAFGADVDGDRAAEIAIAAATPTRPNAFWIFDLVPLGGQWFWQALSPGADAALPAFECDPPGGGFAGFRTRRAFAADVNHDGRDEIVAYSDAPGGLGGAAWIMAYAPPPAPAPLAVGTWSHLDPDVSNHDLETPWPWPARMGHAFRASTRGLNSCALMAAPERVLGPSASDPNAFFEAVFAGGATLPWTVSDPIDCSVGTEGVRLALAADVDGDLTDEIVAVVDTAAFSAAWVMDRKPDGTWQHLSPVSGHPLGADLEWTRGRFLAGALAADLDRTRLGSLEKELVFYGTRSNEIWIMQYDPASRAWSHFSPVLPAGLDADYLLAAYRGLLAQVGTSFEELRTARGLDADGRQALADRLGIPLRTAAGAPDTLDRLLLAPADMGEAQLEELFGLADTRRDPLSMGPVRGDPSGQVRRWELEDVVWSANPWVANVGREGDLGVSLIGLPGARAQVMLSIQGGRAVATGSGDRNGRIRLTGLTAADPSGSIEIAYHQDTTTVALGVLPRLTAWRLSRLRAIWDGQDAPPSPFDAGGNSDGEPVLPLVDPDVLGPDDFRVSLPKATPVDPTLPFDLWASRRAWVDLRLGQLRALQPDLAAMLDTLRPPVGGGAPPEDFPWSDAPATATFGNLLDALTRGPASAAEAARTLVRGKLWLPPDAFLRLMALTGQLRDAGQLADGEWSEVRSILVLALKRRRYELWRSEERTAQVVLGPGSFCPGARPPASGEWPPEVAPSVPLVDPSSLALADMPLGGAGALARGLWRARRLGVEALGTVLRATRSSGLEDMLVFALGTAPAGGWRARAAALAADLASSDPARVASATSAIQLEFSLAPGPFGRLAAIAAKLAAGQLPAEAEWLDVEAVLTDARRTKTEFPAWLAEEQSLGSLLPYWRVFRAALPRWRATDDHRPAWEAALAARSRPPVVDPDRFPATWLRNRSFGEPATQAYAGRRTWLDAQRQALRTALAGAATPLLQLDAVLRAAFFPAPEADRVLADVRGARAALGAEEILLEVLRLTSADVAALALALADPATEARTRAQIASELFLDPADFQRLAAVVAKPATAVTPAEWDDFERTLAAAALVSRVAGALAEAKETGVRSRVLLDRLALRPAAQAQIVEMRAVAAAGGPVLEAEWDVLLAIALRALKQRRTGEWLDEEAGSTPERRIRLGPDHFADPRATEPEPDLDPWLVRLDERQRWQDTLQARTEQDAAAASGLRDAVSRVEESTLPILRDALLRAISPAGADPATWASDRFLIDTREGGCRRATRVSHAIDSVLALLWSLRTGQLRDTHPKLLLDASTFDADWRWIGSYAPWRSAVLVRLYPENLIRPSLRRHRTPAFADLLTSLNSGRELTPAGARALAGRYTAYFRDVCALDVGHMVCARVGAWAPDPVSQPRAFEFLFAMSEASGKAYWSTLLQGRHPPDPGYEQSFWQLVPGMEGDLIGLVGAAAYRPALPTPHAESAPGWVYLFALTRDLERTALVFVRFNLVTRQWESQQELRVPASGAFTARLLGGDPSRPPSLEIDETHLENGKPVHSVWRGSLNAKGLDWNGDPVMIPLWTWTAAPAQLAATPGQLLALDRHLDADGDGVRELSALVAVPAAGGPIEVLALGASGLASEGTTEHATTPGSRVVVGDFDADRQPEIAWTNEPAPGSDTVPTAVFVEKWDPTARRWRAHLPDPASPEGASALLASLGHPTSYAVSGDVDGVNGDEILLGIRDHFLRWHVPGTTIDDWTGAWAALWAVARSGNRYVPNSPFTYVPEPDQRSRYALEALGAAFACSPPESAAGSFAVTGDFDGDGLDEIVVFLTPLSRDRSRGNDFWALDRQADGKLRPMGESAANGLATEGDLSGDPYPVAAAIAADIDGDGRDELVALPSWPLDQNRGSRIWVSDFQPGGGSDPAVGGRWAPLPDLDLSLETVPVTSAVAADLDGDGADELVLFGPGKVWVRKYDAPGGRWIEPDATGLAAILPAGKTVAAACAGRFLSARGEQVAVCLGNVAWANPDDPLPYNLGGDQARRERYLGTPVDGHVQILSLKSPADVATAPSCAHANVKPVHRADGALDDTADRTERRGRTRQAWVDNAGMPGSTMTYLWEAYYDLPVAIALQLQRAGHYASALDWFRLVYDYARPAEERSTFSPLELDAAGAGAPGWPQGVLDWLQDPLDVHAIAATRPGSYTRATLLLIIRCLLEHADGEFTLDTSEAIARARVLYESALALLGEPILDQPSQGCSDLVAAALVRVTDPSVRPVLRVLAGRLAAALDRGTLAPALDELVQEAAGPGDQAARTGSAEGAAHLRLQAAPLQRTLAETLRAEPVALADLALRSPALAAAAARVAELASGGGGEDATAGEPRPGVALALSSGGGASPLARTTPWLLSLPTFARFCSSPNPILQALRMRAELELFKIRTCRNIAGMRRTLELYSAPTDQQSGLPSIGAGGELVLAPTQLLRPTPYRYAALVERAKDLVRTAQQVEALMLASLERRDSEALSLLQARQTVAVAQQQVRLSSLQVKQAEDRVVLAGLQQKRAQLEQDHYTDLLQEGESESEREALDLLAEAAVLYQQSAGWQIAATIANGAAALAYTAAAVSEWSATAAAQALSSTAQVLSGTSAVQAATAQARSTRAQIAQYRASLEDQRQQWQLAQQLATADIGIAAMNGRIEEDGARVAGQQQVVAQLQADNAGQLVDFLHAKFTSVELYDWMSQVLEGVYGSILQHATATARLAAAQLAFERQEGPPPPIAADYWQPGPGSTSDATLGNAPDRMGLTGAERLLQDLVALDQFAFESNRRKLQLTKVLSLAEIAPLELQRLRAEGIASFATRSELFDRDFPGHHLRLVKRVSVSLVALVPPTQGVHATLTSSGVSRVVVGPDLFQPIVLHREPQMVALTSALAGTGLFAFDPQPELANPFEFEGVDTSWEYRLALPGNRFDFSSIADLLVTLDYTALDSADYRQQVVRGIDRRYSGDRAVSLRNDFPDAWWELHNPDQSSTPLAVSFQLQVGEFPANVADVGIEQVALLLVQREGAPRGLTVRLRLADSAAGPSSAGQAAQAPWLVAAPVDGLVSTRRGNAGSWFALLGRSPVGQWGLSLSDSDEVREWIAGDDLVDIVLVVSYQGRTPPWPT